MALTALAAITPNQPKKISSGCLISVHIRFSHKTDVIEWCMEFESPLVDITPNHKIDINRKEGI